MAEREGEVATWTRQGSRIDLENVGEPEGLMLGWAVELRYAVDYDPAFQLAALELVRECRTTLDGAQCAIDGCDLRRAERRIVLKVPQPTLGLLTRNVKFESCTSSHQREHDEASGRNRQRAHDSE